MSIKQTRNVIDYARNFHKELSEFYHNLSDQSDKERVVMLLDYMSRHEKHLEESIAGYEEHAAKIIFDTWVQFTPELEALKCNANMQLETDMTVDDIITIAINFDDCLIGLYQKLSESAQSPEVKEIFGKLLDMENQEKTKMIRQAISFNDI